MNENLVNNLENTLPANQKAMIVTDGLYKHIIPEFDLRGLEYIEFGMDQITEYATIEHNLTPRKGVDHRFSFDAARFANQVLDVPSARVREIQDRAASNIIHMLLVFSDKNETNFMTDVNSSVETANLNLKRELGLY